MADDPDAAASRQRWLPVIPTWAKKPGPWLVFASVLLAVLTVLVGTAETPNKFAASLLQAATIILSIYGAFVLGKDASRDAAQEQVSQHAKSAFRRLLTLYGALERLRAQSEAEMVFLVGKHDGSTGLVRLDLAQMSLDKVRLMSAEQIATGEDALEDWRDLAPDEVARIEAAARERDRERQDETEEIV
ncbi:MAG: hypothetical protein OSB43_06260 [Nocardioides sp.]|uniref:hypothetical protein n=1 Tax=Nocardioides sp. TaxID=35761 RepID=UPI00239F569C|nr:hypothetical protein [Nocardioides sp.]MDE0775854.1 hypothetical protein [Nocardioides sp.]